MSHAPRLDLPGADLLAQGLLDLERGQTSIAALLISIGAPRLKRAGIPLPRTEPNPERRLYEVLAREDVTSAHGRYNALVRRLVSLERAIECDR